MFAEESSCARITTVEACVKTGDSSNRSYKDFAAFILAQMQKAESLQSLFLVLISKFSHHQSTLNQKEELCRLTISNFPREITEKARIRVVCHPGVTK
jgi:hypothetical protein